MTQTRIKAAVITVSDTRNELDDASGDLLVALLLEHGAEVVGKTIIRDDVEAIKSRLVQFTDVGDLNLIVTTGGTGLSPRDNTPEATRAVMEREVPGIPEAIRRSTAAATQMAMLSRGVCGIRKDTLIVNLPGSPKAVKECFDVIRPVLNHAVNQVCGHPAH